MLTANPILSKFVVTSSEATPIQVQQGIVVSRDDLQSFHEEADVNIVKQCISCAKEGKHFIKVICDDTDVFVLLTAYIFKYSIESCIYMESFTNNRSTVNINKTAAKHAKIVPSLVAAHALSGCDSVPKMFGIGKKKIVNVLQQEIYLENLGHIQSDIASVIEECSKFVAACYDIKEKKSLSDARLSLWASRTKKKLSATVKPLKLESLPPTNEAFHLNVLRAHFQACIWMSCLQEKPPEMDSVKYGWIKDEKNERLLPAMFPVGTSPAPDAVLEMVRCNCVTDRPCCRRTCSCVKAQLSCSKFCECYGCTCFNSWTVCESTESDDEEDENEDDDDQ